MKTVSLTINGKEVTAPEGRKLLWVVLDNGIYVPNLCALPDRTEPLAACRLCFVGVDGRVAAACAEPAREGMVVDTLAPEAVRLARTGFELIMSSHPVDCGHCGANRVCELQRIARHLSLGLKPKRFEKLMNQFPVDESNPVFTLNPNKCVLCGRCVWVCRKMGTRALGFAHRGFARRLTTFGDEPVGGSRCLECARCVEVCPTGALAFKDRERNRSKLTCQFRPQFVSPETARVSTG